MRIVVPFTDVHPLTVKALERYGNRVEYRDVSGSEFAYWELLMELWRDGESFILIEQDIEPSDKAIRQLEVCPSLMCAFPSPYRLPRCWNDKNTQISALGCCRISKRLIAKWPHIGEPGKLWDVVLDETYAQQFATAFEEYEQPYPWDICDVALFSALKNLGEIRHVHKKGLVTHHRAFSDIGCLCGKDCGTEPSDRSLGENAKRVIESEREGKRRDMRDAFAKAIC